MLNEIIEGIANQLNRVFGDGYAVYQDDAGQGLEKPCFFITVLKPELSPQMGRRFIKRNSFDVRYFPSAPGGNRELFRVAEQLMEALDFITLPNGDLLHGTGMGYEAADDTLHFLVNYNLPLIRPLEHTNMEVLVVHQEKKG